MDFEIVKDYERPTAKAGAGSPAVDAVMAGETVWLPNVKQTAIQSRFARARAHGFRVITRKGERDGVAGCYIWADKRENGAEK